MPRKMLGISTFNLYGSPFLSNLNIYVKSIINNNLQIYGERVSFAMIKLVLQNYFFTVTRIGSNY